MNVLEDIQIEDLSTFSPRVHSSTELLEFVREQCDVMSKQELAEIACTYCRHLVKKKTIYLITYNDLSLQLLCVSSFCTSEDNSKIPVLYQKGVFSDINGLHIHLCISCYNSLKYKKLSLLALANSLWLEDIPSKLKELNIVKKLLVAYYYYNICVIKVSQGLRKLAENVILFFQPVTKFNIILLALKKEIDNCLLVLFTGPLPPTNANLKCTPLLVQRYIVQMALTQLRDNYSDYKDLIILEENLQTYNNNEVSVAVIYQKEDNSNLSGENIPVYSTDTKEGIKTGKYTFAIGRLTAEKLTKITYDEKKSEALSQLLSEIPMVTYGYLSNLESIYHNSQLFLGIFLWLFLYKSLFHNLEFIVFTILHVCLRLLSC